LPSVSSLEDASEALRTADVEGRRVRIGEDLTTDGLTRVLEHEAGDLTCTVEAGLRLSALQGELGRHGQRLSLDPPGDPTIGALLAENVSGPLRHRFGAPRDLVLGVTLVLADGTIASAGGKVVKNVAGYDLSRLVCGSRGRLALIVRASFRLHPLPKARRTLVVETEDPAAVVSALGGMQVEPSALDVLHPGRVALLFEGSPSAVDAQVDAVRALIGGADGDDGIWAESRRRQGEAVARARFAPGDLAVTLASLSAAVIRPAAGIAYVHGERADGPEPQGDDGQGDARRSLEARIRRAFDPNGTLAG
jgi:glycolate oxidase FAD binding subunit